MQALFLIELGFISVTYRYIGYQTSEFARTCLDYQQQKILNNKLKNERQQVKYFVIFATFQLLHIKVSLIFRRKIIKDKKEKF